MSETCTDNGALTDDPRTSQVIVRIPATPGRELSPNYRGHWRARHRAFQALKEAAFFALYTADRTPPLTPPITVSWTVYWEKRRKFMDHDNLIAMGKPLWDGIKGATLIDDRHYRVGTVEQERDPEGKGYMVLSIEA